MKITIKQLNQMIREECKKVKEVKKWKKKIKEKVKKNIGKMLVKI